MKGKVRGILKGLGESTDLGKVLEGVGVSASAAVRMMEGEDGKRELEARRILAQLHVELLAHRYVALAMVKFFRLLDEKQKLEVRLKAAMAVLGAMGKGEGKELRDKGTEEQRERGEAEGEGEGDGEILRVVAELLEEKRREGLET